MAAINVRAQQATAPVLTPGARQDLTVTRDGSGTHLVSVTGDGFLERLNLLSAELLPSRATLRRSSAAQLPLAVAAGVQGDVYVAIQSATTNGATTFAIQRIIAIP
jgi:hypothetical protein